MAVTLFARESTVFHYQMLPSSFKLAEAPTYIAWQILNSAQKCWNQEAANSSQRFINRTLAVLSGVGGCLAGMVALPITLACTPVTIVADIIVGAAECLFCQYHGLSDNDIKKIAYRKFIVSPLQQFIFCSAAIFTAVVCNALFFDSRFLRPALSISYLSLFVALPYWFLSYCLGQVAVGNLPSNLNHYSFNIFINGGSGRRHDRKWLDEDILPNAFFNSRSVPEKWENYIEREKRNLCSDNAPGINEKHIAFKKGVLEQKEPRELLGLNDGFSEQELKTSYRALALIFHPDKNSSKEATNLFKILNEANSRLSKNRLSLFRWRK